VLNPPAVLPELLMFQRGRLELFFRKTQMNQKLISIALFGVISLPLAVHAETANLDEVVVTAARLPQVLNKTLADVSVISETEIRASNAPDIASLLRSVVGVEVSQTGGIGSAASVFMRGTSSIQVLILLDGVRVNSASTGTTALDQIMLDNIERIEIVRGNVSSLYGSEAIGGVIQLFTKQGHGAPAFNASAGIGNLGSQRAAAGFNGEVGDNAFSLNASRIRTDGVSAINPQLKPVANPNANGYDNNTLNAQFKHRFNADHAVSAAWFSTRGNLSFDNGSGYNGSVPSSPTDVNTAQSGVDKFSLTSDDQLHETWHSTLRLAQGRDDSQNYLNGAPNGHFQTLNNQASWQNNLQLTVGQKLSLAAEYLQQAVSSDTAFTQTSRTVNSLLGGYTGDYGAQQVQLNVRQDAYSDFGTANVGLLGYGLAFNDAWRATANISNAFKAPTFNDMYYPLSSGYSGNPNLKPERSQNQELGVHYAEGFHRVNFVYFNNKINDLIAINSAGSTMVNINQAQIVGQEISYHLDLGNKHFKANLTVQDPRDSLTGALLPLRAKTLANLSASHQLANVGMGVEVRYSGERSDSYYDNNSNKIQTTLPSYALLNLTANYILGNNLTLKARVDNLFNKDYAEAYSYQTLGRTLFVSLNYQQ
jgi:vitamin B12 transporter